MQALAVSRNILGSQDFFLNFQNLIFPFSFAPYSAVFYLPRLIVVLDHTCLLFSLPFPRTQAEARHKEEEKEEM